MNRPRASGLVTSRATADPAGAPTPPSTLHVVVVGAAAPTRSAIEPGLRALADTGARVTLLLLNLPADPAVLAGLPAARRRLVLTRWSVQPPPNGGLRRLLDGVTFRALRLAGRTASPRARVLRAVRRDPVARSLIASADVLVALDRHAVHPVWRAAGRRRPAFYGLAAAVRFVGARTSSS